MKKIVLIAATFLVTFSVFSQTIFGKWTTVDEQTGEEKSIVEIYERDGKVFGKIVEILNSRHKDALCEKCEGDEKNTPVLGLVLMKNMEKQGKYYKNGTIFHPERGKKYKCRITLDDENPDLLQVRGYVAFVYATQYWKRVK